jgi:hypothetical protein
VNRMVSQVKMQRSLSGTFLVVVKANQDGESSLLAVRGVNGCRGEPSYVDLGHGESGCAAPISPHCRLEDEMRSPYRCEWSDIIQSSVLYSESIFVLKPLKQ